MFPGEGASDAVRSTSRFRGVILAGLAGGVSKAIALATTLVSAPLTISYLGTERFGLWMTVSSLLTLLAFADLGIGNGLVNVVARHDARSDREAMRESISSAYVLLTGIAILLLGVFLAIYEHVPWSRLFGTHTPQGSGEAGPAVLALVVFLCVSLPLTAVQKVQLGLQKSWIANVWQSAGAVVSLIFTLFAVWHHRGVVVLIVAMAIGPAMAMLANSLLEFSISRPDLMPRWRYATVRTAKSLLKVGAAFFVLQVTSIAANGLDTLVVAQLFGASAVGPYAVTYKLYQLVLIAGLFLQPLWPAFGEALARGDYVWARKAVNLAIRLSVGVGLLLGLSVAILGDRIIALWVGEAVVPGNDILLSFACWILLASYGGVISAFLNNGMLLRYQLKTYTLASVAAVALKYPLAAWLGASGVVWATVVAYFVLYCLPATFKIYGALRYPPSAQHL